MKAVKAYKTSDGMIHTDKLAATKAEFAISIQGFFNINGRKDTVISNNISVRNIGSVLEQDMDTMIDLLKSHKRALSRMEPKTKKTNAKGEFGMFVKVA